MQHALMHTPIDRHTERAGKNLVDFLKVHQPTDVTVHWNMSQYARWPVHHWHAGAAHLWVRLQTKLIRCSTSQGHCANQMRQVNRGLRSSFCTPLYYIVWNQYRRGHLRILTTHSPPKELWNQQTYHWITQVAGYKGLASWSLHWPAKTYPLTVHVHVSEMTLVRRGDDTQLGSGCQHTKRAWNSEKNGPVHLKDNTEPYAIHTAWQVILPVLQKQTAKNEAQWPYWMCNATYWVRCGHCAHL